MSTLHPHWKATDDTTDIPAKEPSATPMKTVSRKPGAIVGVLISTTAIAATFASGIGSLTGSIADELLTITITENGIVPMNATAYPGQGIEWINETSMPQILLSDNLCSQDGTCLYTPQFFPGETAEYTIDSNIALDTYQYVSTTKVDLSGTITVIAIPEDDTVTDDTQQTEEAEDPSTLQNTESTADTLPGDDFFGTLPVESESLIQEEGVEEPIEEEVLEPTETKSETIEAEILELPEVMEDTEDVMPVDKPDTLQIDVESYGGSRRVDILSLFPDEANVESMEQESKSEYIGHSGVAGLPRNPYTVGSNTFQDQEFRPFVPVEQFTPPENENLHAGAPGQTHKPISQPKTGSGVWIAVLSSVLLFLFISRRHLHSA